MAQDTTHRVEGFDWGILPAVSYNSDYGLHYGVYGELFFYGKDSLCRYPDYRHMLYFEFSRYTGGQTLGFIQYDAKSLIPNARFSSVLSYQLDPLYFFYGYNGSAEIFDNNLNNNRESGTAFYSVRRQQIHFDATLQGAFNSRLNWVCAAAMWSLRMEDITDDDFDTQNTLYKTYLQNNLIRENEAQGGTHIEIKAGISFDTRDNETAPNRGLNIDAFFNGSPDLFGTGFNYLKFNFHLRNYISLSASHRFIFAYHLAYQGTLLGEVPFYLQNNINVLTMRQTSSEGLGGYNSVRGLVANRLLGNGYAWGNVEMRIRLFEFNLLKRHWAVGTNPFFDAGVITQGYRMEEQAQWHNSSISEIKKEAGKPYLSAGLGFKLSMNQNFILSLEVAKVIHTTPEQYPLGFYFNLNYIF